MADNQEMEVLIKRVGVLVHGAGPMLDVAAMEVERKAKANALAKGGRHFWVSEIVNSLHTEAVGGSRVRSLSPDAYKDFLVVFGVRMRNNEFAETVGFRSYDNFVGSFGYYDGNELRHYVI